MIKTRSHIILCSLGLALSTLALAADIPPLAPLGPPPIPADNPQTPEKIQLGRLLFFDGRLGGDTSTPCVGCHIPSMGWDWRDNISRGYPGTIHWRNSQTIINSAYYSKLFWAGASSSLESQARSAARGGVAGNGESDLMEVRLALIPEYRERFRQVFGSEVAKSERCLACHRLLTSAPWCKPIRRWIIISEAMKRR